jgi:hypothetical protein
VSAGELIRVRREEALSFERFRESLRLAIQDRLKTSQAAPAQLATEIVDDVVNPALNDIQQRLNAAREILAKKSAISIGVGAISTTVGLIAGMPLLLPAGVAWALLPGQHYMKYLEEKREIELSGMYFLWRQEHAALRG